jgi:hypothetical protein
MTKPDECRTNAQECERIAGKSLNPNDKSTWLGMAKHWLHMIPNAGTGSERFESAQGIGQTTPGKSGARGTIGTTARPRMGQPKLAYDAFHPSER